MQIDKAVRHFHILVNVVWVEAPLCSAPVLFHIMNKLSMILYSNPLLFSPFISLHPTFPLPPKRWKWLLDYKQKTVTWCEAIKVASHHATKRMIVKLYSFGRIQGYPASLFAKKVPPTNVSSSQSYCLWCLFNNITVASYQSILVLFLGYSAILIFLCKDSVKSAYENYFCCFILHCNYLKKNLPWGMFFFLIKLWQLTF